jgi:uncharacterized membrane protein YhhN
MIIYLLLNNNFKKIWMIVLGFLFALVGEIIYDWADKSISHYGLSLYAATIILVTIHLFLNTKFKIKDLLYLIPSAAMFILFIVFLCLYSNTTSLIETGFCLYFILLSLMVWRSFFLKKDVLVKIGCCLWAISDIMLMCGTLFVSINNYPLWLDAPLWIGIRVGMFFVSCIKTNQQNDKSK